LIFFEEDLLHGIVLTEWESRSWLHNFV
jgi:hypothetical protein